MARPDSDASLEELVREHAALEEGIVAARWSDGTLQPVPVGHRAPIDGQGVLGRMLRDPRPVRIEDWDEAGRRIERDLHDDGAGGAETGRGSGLSGLTDRVEAVGGHLEITSPAGEGTRIRARLPTRVLGSLNGSSWEGSVT